MAFFDQLTLTTFAAQDRSRILGVFSLDSIARETQNPHAAVFECDLRDAHERLFFDEAIAGVAIDPSEPEHYWLLGQWGAAYQVRDSQIFPDGFDADRGPMMRLRCIGEVLYAVGSAVQIYRKTAHSDWEYSGPDPSDLGESRLTVLTDIDGFSEKEIYASGTRGTIWRLEDGAWTKIDCPTNLAFHAIHCADDGYVYACGQLGLLMRGRGDQFELLSPGQEPIVDLWGVARFGGVLYCSGFRALLEWKDDRLQPHMPAMKKAAYFYGLEVKDGVLWSCGEKSLVRYNGDTWDVANDLNWIPVEND